MSVRLVFRDPEGNTLYDKDIIYDGSAPLPKKNDLVQFSDGPSATVESRRFVDLDSEHGQTDVQVIFVCKTEKKHTVSKSPVKGF